MSAEIDFELMRKLSQTPGVSGFEDEVAVVFRDELAKYVNSVRIDKMGNVIGRKTSRKTDAPTVMVLAHLDEIGLMTKYIEDSGFIRFEKVGDLVDYLFPGKRVVIHGEKGPVLGIVGVVPAHMIGSGTWGGPERLTSPSTRDQFIDVGAKTREEVEEMGITVGSPITFEADVKRVGKSYLTGKAMDDRASYTP